LGLRKSVGRLRLCPQCGLSKRELTSRCRLWFPAFVGLLEHRRQALGFAALALSVGRHCDDQSVAGC